MERICTCLFGILFLCSGSVEIVHYVKSLVKSDIPNGLCTETIMISQKNIGIVSVFYVRYIQNIKSQGVGTKAS